MHLYKNCGDLPIFNFDVVYRTNDFKCLIVDYNGYDDIVVPKDANERWEAIKNEWVELLDDATTAYYYQLVLEIVYLQTRYNIVRQLLKIVWDREDMDEDSMKIYIGALKEWRYFWNEKATKTTEVDRLLKQLKRSQNKITLKLDELEKMREENDMDNEDSSTLDKQAVALEQITGKNNIDTRTTSVSKWVEITKLAETINEQRRKSNGK
jgi:hypothetical protein